MIFSDQLASLLDCSCDECLTDYLALVTKWKIKSEYLSISEAIDKVDFNMRAQAAKEALRNYKWEYAGEMRW